MSKNVAILVETALIAALAMVLFNDTIFASWFYTLLGAIPLVLSALRRGSKLEFWQASFGDCCIFFLAKFII